MENPQGPISSAFLTHRHVSRGTAQIPGMQHAPTFLVINTLFICSSDFAKLTLNHPLPMVGRQ